MTRRLVVLAVASVLLSSCAASGLSFRQDDRVSIKAPPDTEGVTLPLQIEWEAKGYDGYFAVFLDGTPMRPNQGLLALVPEDDPCRARPACPDAKWLAERRIFVTKETSLVIATVPERRGTDRHDLTIVLLDEDGTRNGESAFVREFVVERDT
jgi:hypothetical protein